MSNLGPAFSTVGLLRRLYSLVKVGFRPFFANEEVVGCLELLSEASEFREC